MAVLQTAELDQSSWTSYTPTVGSGSGSFTTVSATGRYKQIGKTVFVMVNITITNAGTAAGYISATLPFTAASNAYTGSAFETVTSKSGAALVIAALSTSFMVARNSDGTTMIATGNNPIMGMLYELP